MEYTHEFTCGEVHTRMKLDPVVLLEPGVEAIEHVYPEVQKIHRARLRRIKELSAVKTSALTGIQLMVKVQACQGLKETDGRLPTPFVKGQILELEHDGYRKRAGDVLQVFKTKAKKSVRDAKWGRTFETCRVMLKDTMLRLTVYSKGKKAIDHEFLGLVEVDFHKLNLPYDAVNVALQPQRDTRGNVTKPAQGTISFNVRRKKDPFLLRMLGKASSLASNIEEEEDPHMLLTIAMKKKVYSTTFP